MCLHINKKMSPKQRMLNAYRGIFSDRYPVAPEFWYYYPAKVLGVDMIQFAKEVPFHIALKKTFEKFDCEGWGIVFCNVPNEKITSKTVEKWLDSNTLQTRTMVETPKGRVECSSIMTRDEPGWVVERFIKDRSRDVDTWECLSLDGEPEKMDCSPIVNAMAEVGESFLLEAWIGVPFFDFYAGAREGGFEKAVYDFLDDTFQMKLEKLRQRYVDFLLRLIRKICHDTQIESFCIGCSWSCNSLIGPEMWRRWDKPVIKAVADEVHKYHRLLHVHFHGKCKETISDFAEIGIDCVCPFERPPGGDVNGIDDLHLVTETLKGKTTMNGNVHTVETLIRGNVDKVKKETMEILEAFSKNPRLIVGTGDQVGKETPEENLYAMIETVKAWRQ